MLQIKISFIALKKIFSGLQIVKSQTGKLKDKHYCYILTCNDKTLYCGYTNDLVNRLKKHNAGKGAKYTKTRLPVFLSYYEEFNSKSDALKREWQIKKLSRNKKLQLIENYEINHRTKRTN